MGVSFGQSRIADLTFQVFGRVVHPDWFAVRSHCRLSQAAWEADVRIIEGGHAIVWRSGRIRVTEILSGPETLLPPGNLLFQSTIRHEKTVSLKPGFGTEYQACFEVDRTDPEVFAHINDELALDATKGGLFHSFAPSNRLAAAPISHLRFEVKPSWLQIQAFHTFPDERAVVRTQSLLEVRSDL